MATILLCNYATLIPLDQKNHLQWAVTEVRDCRRKRCRKDSRKKEVKKIGTVNLYLLV